jgi:cyclophilin family peptidyl-prolyl cis-trans isomerase
MFNRLLLAAGLLLPVTLLAQQPAAPAEAIAPETAVAEPAVANPRVALRTNQGDIVIELEATKAPKSTENFLQYVKDGHYNGTIFHRVIDGFMAQGGGFTVDLQMKPTRPAIDNEANNGLSNARGTIAMARTGEPHSAQAQFFINVVDNPRLDFVSEQNGFTWGYAVFAKVVEGMDVVDRIRAIPTGPQGPFAKDVPTQAVIIERADLLGEAPSPAPAAGG